MSKQLSRRMFLKIGLVAGGGLLVGCSRAPLEPVAIPVAVPTVVPTLGPTMVPTVDPAADLPVAPLVPSIWLRIDPDEQITITAHKSEMGQGVHTAFALIVAEELDAALERVVVLQADADGRYGNQATSGSNSLNESYSLLRRGAATARHMLLSAAAQALGVAPDSLQTAAGLVIDPASDRRLSYGQLAGAAALLVPPAPAEVQLKERGDFRLIGTRVPRLEARDKIAGATRYGLDVRLPGMQYAVLARSPVFGGTLLQYDEAAALAVPGVRKIVPLEQAVAVVADTTWAAMRGRDALAATWDAGPQAALDDATIAAALENGLSTPLARVMAGAEPEGSVGVVEASYSLPFQAHSPLEPTNYTADVRGETAEIWAPAQDPQTARLMAASAVGLSPDAVTLHVTALGGAFGRRLRHDGIAEACLVSQALAGPVQLIYTREDELQHGFYHPASAHRMRAHLAADGTPLSWSHAMAAGFSAGGFRIGMQPPYRIASRRAEGALVSSAVPQGWWRGIDYVQTTFAQECFLDEIAAAGGRDPLELRRTLIDDPRLLAVLNLAAEQAGWGQALPAGSGRGIALCAYNQVRVAQIAEVRVAADGAVRVERVTVAVDCGLPVNPLGIEAQIESSIVFGLTATLKSAITIQNGGVAQRNFDGFPLLRIDEMPQVSVHIIESGSAPHGMGEPAVPPLAPAVLNAIYAATGRRVRSLPVSATALS